VFSRDLQPIKGRVIDVRRAKTFGGGSIGPLASQHESYLKAREETEKAAFDAKLKD
jgi:hypothetical protein